MCKTSIEKYSFVVLIIYKRVYNSMRSRKEKLLLNTISSLSFQITTIICGFILPRLILNSYGSEVNGLINSITQFLGIISFLELGVGAVIQSSLYKPLAVNDQEQVSKVVVSGQKFFSKLALILLIYVIFLMVIYPIFAKQNFGFLYTATMIAVISISSFAQYYFGIVNRLLLTADQKGYISYNTQTITLVLNTVLCFVLIKWGYSIHIVKLTTSLIYVLRPLFLSVYVKHHYNIDWKIQYTEEPIKQKWNGVAQHIAAVVLEGTDNIVLTIFDGLKAVSVYSVYNLVISGIKQLLISTTNGIQSLMGELWVKKEFKELKVFFGWVEWAIHTGTVFIFGTTSTLILPFVTVYTRGIADANYNQPLFAYLIVLANAGHCLRLPYNLMILAGGHYKQTQSNYIVAALLNIFISVIAVNKWGLVGVAIGTVIAMFYQTIWMALYDSKNLIEWPIGNFIKQILVDFLTVLLLHIVIKLPFTEKFFSMHITNYIGWFELAIKNSVVSIGIVIILNFLFYRSYIEKIFYDMKTKICRINIRK